MSNISHERQRKIELKNKIICTEQNSAVSHLRIKITITKTIKSTIDPPAINHTMETRSKNEDRRPSFGTSPSKKTKTYYAL